MRVMIRMFVLAAIGASATVAFASETMAVNVPFNFEDHGKAFPAGGYQVEYDSTMNSLTLLSKTDTKKSLMWIAGPAEYSSDMARLTLRFDSEADGAHALAASGWLRGKHRYWIKLDGVPLSTRCRLPEDGCRK